MTTKALGKNLRAMVPLSAFLFLSDKYCPRVLKPQEGQKEYKIAALNKQSGKWFSFGNYNFSLPINTDWPSYLHIYEVFRCVTPKKLTFLDYILVYHLLEPCER